MRPIPLLPPSPVSLTLAADCRLVETDYLDDQIWELRLGGEPPGLALETTYGLRARMMTVFPSFQWFGRTRADPTSFSEPPILVQAFPNYLRLRCRPFDQLEVEAEYWAYDSHTVLGRLSLLNTSEVPQEHRLRLHALLRPADGGQPMAERNLQGATVLVGKTSKLEPMLFLAGGAFADMLVHPALTVGQLLQPGEPQRLVWVASGQRTAAAGFEVARRAVDLAWDQEVGRIERVNGGWVEVETGDPDWDAALWMAQKAGLGCLLSSSHHLPFSSAVAKRGIDDGYSAKGDGRDHADAWSGQGAFAAFALASQIRAAAPKQVEGLLHNFFYTQSARGEVDRRPGLAGQRAGDHCPPLLATIAWRLYRQTGSKDFLRELAGPLTDYFNAWFDRKRDRDGDGLPEWENPVQSGYPESPTFVQWADWGQGLDIRLAECPDLAAYLARDCISLIAIHEAVGRTEAIPPLEAKLSGLRQALARAWSEKDGRWLPLDRDTHVSGDGKRLGKLKGAGRIAVGKKFEPEVRLVVRLLGPEEDAHRAQITIHGRGPKGQFRTERIERGDIHWFWNVGTVTSENTFASVEKVAVKGLSKVFRVEVHLPDSQRPDVTQWLPLWSGAVNASQVEQALATLLRPEGLWRSAGIASVPADSTDYLPDEHFEACGVRPLWNEMLGEALLEAGRSERAAVLVDRLMAAAIGSLKSGNQFHAYYHPDRLEGMGPRGHSAGLAPLGLFLRTLGVHLVHGRRVEIRGANPFPWPVTIRWRGLSVHRPLAGPTQIEMADGSRVEVPEGHSLRAYSAAS